MQCNAMQCNAMQCNAMQCSAVQCSAMQCNAIQCNAMQCNTLQYNTIQYNTIQYNAIQRNATQRNAMRRGAMRCNAIQCNTLQYTTAVVKSATTYATIEEFRKLFADKGIPETVMTDNGTCFTSGEFQTFMKRNYVTHKRTPAYHPSSNGLAERAVQVVKKMRDGSLETRLARFLLTHRVTPHATTGVALCELLVNRRIRTVFDAVMLDINRKVYKHQQNMKDMYDRHTTNRDVKVGDAVFVKNHVGHGPKWLPSALIECDSDVIVSETLDGRIMRPHMDHVRSRHSVTQPQSQPIVEEIPVPEIDSDSTPTTSDANRDIAVDREHSNTCRHSSTCREHSSTCRTYCG